MVLLINKDDILTDYVLYKLWNPYKLMKKTNYIKFMRRITINKLVF